MKESALLCRRIALTLIECAEAILPIARSEWAKAMRAELASITSDYRAAIWAFGCVVTSVKERVVTMGKNPLKVSRWVLAPEMALCFVPGTLGWLDSVFGPSGVTRLNMDIIEQHFIGTPSGTAVLVGMFANSILGLLFPVGIYLAIRFIAFHRPFRSQPLGTVLIVASLLIGLGFAASHFVLGSKSGLWDSVGIPVVMFCILPVVGVVHMLHIGVGGKNAAQ